MRRVNLLCVSRHNCTVQLNVVGTCTAISHAVVCSFRSWKSFICQCQEISLYAGCVRFCSWDMSLSGTLSIHFERRCSVSVPTRPNCPCEVIGDMGSELIS